MQYYFLSSRLPELDFSQQPDISWEEFLFLLDHNLSAGDKRWVNVLRSYYDLENMRRFWSDDATHDLRGSLTEQELEEALVNEDPLPAFVTDYLDKYPHQQDRLRHFSSLLTAYFAQIDPKAPKFLRDYLAFERQLRLVLTGFRAKTLNRDLALELQYEDPDDPLVAQLMAQKDAKSFEPPEGFESLKSLFQQHADKPLDLYRALAEYRFRWIDARLESELFSIDRILGYLIQLTLVLQWQALDREQGQKRIDTIVEDAL